MTDVLLATSYFLALDPKQVRKMKPYPPLATLYAAAGLRQAGHRVALYDAMLEPDESTFAAALAQHQPRYVVLYEDSFNFLTKMCLSRMRTAAQRMAEMATAAGATVVAAGPDATDHPEAFLEHGVAYVLAGEADHSVRELLAMLQRGVAVNGQLEGVLHLHNGQVVGGPPRQPERRPDVFGHAAWDLVDVAAYRQVWIEHHGHFSLNLVSTRGCPFHCNWCAKPIWGQRYAMRSPQAVAEELALVKRELRPDHIWFADDIFGLRTDWVVDFAAAVQALDAALPFTIQSRVDLMTDAAVAALAAAGCREVWLGAESGSQRILDAMDKGVAVAATLAARERLRQAGLQACFFLQFGYPGETWDDIMATVTMVREALPDQIGVSVSYPLPGTVFYERVAAQLGTKDHWSDSDDLAMLFSGTYQTAFYRQLHTVIHADLDYRLSVRDGRDTAAVAAECKRVEAMWEALGRMAEEHLSPAPTQLARYASPAPPSLLQEYN